MTAATWSKLHATRSWGRWPCEDIVAACCRHVPDLLQRGRALDIGCGQGAHLRFLSDEGWFARGIDVPEAINRIPSYHDTTLVACDLEDDPEIVDGDYQIVIDNVTTCHLTDTAARRIYRCLTESLRPGSLLVARDFSRTPDLPDDIAVGIRGHNWWLAVLRDWSRVRTKAVITTSAHLWHIEAIR